MGAEVASAQHSHFAVRSARRSIGTQGPAGAQDQIYASYDPDYLGPSGRNCGHRFRFVRALPAPHFTQNAPKGAPMSSI
jgi:hypothetical protein